jgi:hypothetical protein
VPVGFEADDEGYFDRECPSETCLFQFKIWGEDWLALQSRDALWCPLCGHSAGPGSWWTKEQLEYAKQVALGKIQGGIREAIRKDSTKFNQRQPKGGLLRMSMQLKEGRSLRRDIPQPAGESLDLRIKCESCSTQFAVLGSAFFCPACGHNSALRTFADGLRKVRAKLTAADVIRAALVESVGKDEAELIIRSMIETALADSVVALQRLCERLYDLVPAAPPLPQNTFQRIDDGMTAWVTVLGLGYDHWLSASELDRLRLLFQRRHLLAHTEGIVDAKYLQRSGDTAYQLGQRLVVRVADGLELAELVHKLGEGLRAELINRGYSV